MYYYEIQDVNGAIIKQPTTPYDTGTGAVDAAKDDLATMYPPSYPVEVRIYDGPPNDPYRYCSSTYYLSEEDIRQHALKRIEEANRQEFADIVQVAMKRHEQLADQYSRGLITPLDFARSEEGSWINARYSIEGKMNV